MTLREIFISVQTELRGGQEVFNAASDEAAQQKVLTARERALKGEDFATLVAEFSESGSKANGGLIGPVNLNELSEGLRDRLLKLSQGDVDEPIRTPKGYQLLKVEQKSEAAPRPFEDVRNEIGNKVMQERGQALLDAYLISMREQAIIEWRDDELKQLYEQYRASKKN
jgi:parvulin-like peptidyl-prolyl isomerase